MALFQKEKPTPQPNTVGMAPVAGWWDYFSGLATKTIKQCKQATLVQSEPVFFINISLKEAIKNNRKTHEV